MGRAVARTTRECQPGPLKGAEQFPSCRLPLEGCHPPLLASSWETDCLCRLAFTAPPVPAGSMEECQAAGQQEEMPEASPSGLSRCSHLLPISISSPVGPPALLPLYFQWYIFYFVIQRKKWVVSILAHEPRVLCPQFPEGGAGLSRGTTELPSRQD